MREIRCDQHKLNNEEWRGQTIEVLVADTVYFKEKLQAIGWFDRPVRLSKVDDSPFAGLAHFLKAAKQAELQRLQTTTDRTKVVIEKNAEGVLPEAGERWTILVTGQTVTKIGLMLFGKPVKLVSEAEGGNPTIRKLEELGTSKLWCSVHASHTTGHFDDDFRSDTTETRTLEFQGKFDSVTMDRDETGNPIITLSLRNPRARQLFYNEDERCMDWGRWRDEIGRRAFELWSVTRGDCGTFYARSNHRNNPWDYRICFSNSESC